MRKYEITYLTVNEEGHDAASVNAILSDNKASIVSVHPWGARRKLVYPIKKQDQAFYTTVVFEAEPSSIQAIERAVTLSNDILRALVVLYEPGFFERANATPQEESTTKDDVTPASAEATTPEVTEEVATPEPESEPTEEAPKKKRSTKKTTEETESLDEKLDALLNEDITK